MFAFLNCINRSATFWWALIIFCLAQEGIALYYQHGLGYLPCELCVEVRAWVLAILIVALFGLIVRKSSTGLALANTLGLLTLLGLAHRAYLTYGTEQGFILGECGQVSANFPSWLPLDQWFPMVFMPLEPCGTTPWLIPKFITMAQGLMLVSIVLVTLMLLMIISQFQNRLAKRTRY